MGSGAGAVALRSVGGRGGTGPLRARGRGRGALGQDGGHNCEDRKKEELEFHLGLGSEVN